MKRRNKVSGGLINGINEQKPIEYKPMSGDDWTETMINKGKAEIESNEMNKGIIQFIRENGGSISYDPLNQASLLQMFQEAVKFDEKYKSRKQEYILSKWQAENLPMGVLNWLGENCNVLVSCEVSNIIKERASKEIK